jgi:ubiquinone/menaquinone biosynthesis C-methylase UbiE
MTKTSVERHFDKIAKDYDFYKGKSAFYYSNLKQLLKNFIPDGKRVLEIGCGTGDLLASLNPKMGYGMDISGEMVKLAKKKHELARNLTFSTSLPDHKSLDVIFMSDVIEHLENPGVVFNEIQRLMGPDTIFINTMMNPLWEPIERVYSWMGLKMPEGPHKRYSFDDLRSIIKRSQMKIIDHDFKLLMPINVPLVSYFVNKYLEKSFRRLAFIEYVVVIKK